MNWIQIYFVTFLTAFVLTLILTPVCQKIAPMIGYLDVPASEKHKGHKKATPLLGGLAMFSAWILTVLVALGASGYTRSAGLDEQFTATLQGLRSITLEFWIICLCAGGAMLLGLIDDKFPLRASVKFLGQLLIAVTAVTWGGLRITVFLDCAPLTWVISICWILLLFNAVNFFDNMDGLAIGTAAIAFTFFMAAAIVNEQYFVATLAACSAAVSYGFWFYNHTPASIFMGDSGSHFIAFLLAVVSARVSYYDPQISGSRFAIFIPVFVLAVPLFDAFAVMVIRLLNHKPLYVGDHNHISHRFEHMGMSRKRAVLLVHLLCLLAGLGALPLLWGEEKTCILLFVQGVVILLILTILQYSGHLSQQSSSSGETSRHEP